MYRVINKNKYTERICAFRWSFAKNHCMMHGEQNVKLKVDVNHIQIFVLSEINISYLLKEPTPIISRSYFYLRTVTYLSSYDHN